MEDEFWVDDLPKKILENLKFIDKNLDDREKLLNHMCLLMPNEEFLNPELDVVFSHNDIHGDNILVSHMDKTKVKFIDFELSSFGYKEYDIANMLNESQFDYHVFNEDVPFVHHNDKELMAMHQGGEGERIATLYLKRYHALIYKGMDNCENFVNE